MNEIILAQEYFFSSNRQYIHCDYSVSGLDTCFKGNCIELSVENLPKKNDIEQLKYQFEVIEKFLHKFNIDLMALLRYKSIHREFNGNIKELKEQILHLRFCYSNGETIVRDIPYKRDNISRIIDILSTIYLYHYDYVDKVSQDLDCIILSPKAASFLIHEIIGHLLEYDYTQLKHSIFQEDKIGQKIMPSKVNIIEDPITTESIGLSFGKFDDIGNKLKKQILIKDGILHDLIKYQRVDTYNHLPLYRMHNIFLDNNLYGDSKREIIRATYNGILVNNSLSAFVNPITGDFQLECNDCYYIKNGCIYGKVRNFILNGSVYDISQNIIDIGNDLEHYISYCSKLGQILPVGVGSPTIILNTSGLNRIGV